jgi:hypothetical protein
MARRREIRNNSKHTFGEKCRLTDIGDFPGREMRRRDGIMQTRIPFIFLWLYSLIQALAASMKLSFSLQFFFVILHSGGGSPTWVHSARRPLTGLLYLPGVIVRMENLVEWMAGETEVLGETLPWRHFVHHKSHLTRPGIEPGPPRWEASD